MQKGFQKLPENVFRKKTKKNDMLHYNESHYSIEHIYRKEVGKAEPG